MDGEPVQPRPPAVRRGVPGEPAILDEGVGQLEKIAPARPRESALDEPHDELWWVKQKLRREQLSYLPPTLAVRKEADDALAAASRARSERDVRRIVVAINAKIREANGKAASGPPLNLMPFDVERVVRRWRERHARP